MESGYRFGCIGMRIFEQYNIQQWTGRVYSLFYGFLHDLKMPMKDSIEPLKRACMISLETGDVEYGCLCGNLRLWSQFQMDPLDQLYMEVQSHAQQLKLFGQYHTLEMLKPTTVTIRNLLWNANIDINCPSNEFIDESEYNDNQSPSDAVLGWNYILQMLLCYLFGHYEKAYEHSQRIMSSSVVKNGCRSDLPLTLLFIGLTNIEYVRKHVRYRLTLAKKCLKQIKEFATYGPSNSLGKKFLLEAEIASIQKNHIKALEKYTCAIALSKDSGFIMETGLGYERAAKELVRMGDYQRASTYFEEAVKCYEQWGSPLKVKHLRREMESIIKPSYHFPP
jgi:tetratricopeptide (TPR) repeat protein